MKKGWGKGEKSNGTCARWRGIDPSEKPRRITSRRSPAAGKKRENLGNIRCCWNKYIYILKESNGGEEKRKEFEPRCEGKHTAAVSLFLLVFVHHAATGSRRRRRVSTEFQPLLHVPRRVVEGAGMNGV